MQKVPSLPLGEPTTARPGSAEKVAVLEQRASLGLDLWHPLDLTDFGPRQVIRGAVPEGRSEGMNDNSRETVSVAGGLDLQDAPGLKQWQEQIDRS